MRYNHIEVDDRNEERVVERINVRAYSRYQISLPLRIVKKLKLDENDVILYRFSHAKNVHSIGKVIKIIRKKNNEISYKLSIRKEALQKAGLNLPQTIKIEILDINKMGYKPSPVSCKKNIVDIISFLPDDWRVTCFKKSNDKLLIYYINNKATCVAELQRTMKLNDFCLWNIGFYIAEGLKTNVHRVSASNNKHNLLKKFVGYLQSFGIDKNKIRVDVKVKPENYDIFLKKYWSSKLGLHPNRINIRRMYTNPTNAKYGNAEVTVYNTILGMVHKNLVNYIINSVTMLSNNQLKSLIKGLEDGDGYVMLHNGMMEIGITCEKEFTNFVKTIYTKLYSRPRITPHSTSNKVDKTYFQGKKNALKFLLDNHFTENVERRNKLIELIKKFMRRDLKYLKALELKPQNLSNIAKITSVTNHAVSEMLSKHIENGLVEVKQGIIKSNGKTYNTSVYSLTEKGTELLNILMNN